MKSGSRAGYCFRTRGGGGGRAGEGGVWGPGQPHPTDPPTSENEIHQRGRKFEADFTPWGGISLGNSLVHGGGGFRLVVASLRGPAQSVTRSSLRMLHRVAAFCRLLRLVLLLVLFPRSRSPVVGVLGLCWMWQFVPVARQQRPVVGVLGLCWLLWGLFDCFCCPHTSVLRPSTTCLCVSVCVSPTCPAPRGPQRWPAGCWISWAQTNNSAVPQGPQSWLLGCLIPCVHWWLHGTHQGPQWWPTGCWVP